MAVFRRPQGAATKPSSATAQTRAESTGDVSSSRATDVSDIADDSSPESVAAGLMATTGSLNFDRADGSTSDELSVQIDEWVETARPRLGEVLMKLGAINSDDLIEALQRQKEAPDDEGANAKLGEILMELGSLSDTALAGALAEQFNVPLAELTNVEIEQAAVAKVPEEMARRYRVLPTHIDDGRVFLACADPLDTEAIEALTKQCNRIGLMIGPRHDIDRLIDQAYNALSSADDIIRAFELSTNSRSQSLGDDTFHVDEGAPLIQVVNRILTQGARIGASDIHIQPAERSVRVRYRVDGAMTEAIRLPESMGPAVASRLKVLAELNIVERRRPQDGQFSIEVDGRAIDVRLSVVPTINGEKAVMRLLDKSKSLISMNALGMIPAVEEPYLKMARSPLGMILCTGPTGAGKTTTLYATLNEVNDPTKNVVTIEDPVEYQFDGVAQMQVSESGMSFADGLRGILRQDPDVILVGEIRDAETARIAMQAALTGHLVLSSLHSIDSVAAVHRFIDMGIEPFLVSSALNGIVAQRLLRRLCMQCRVPTTPTRNELSLLSEHTDGQLPDTWYRSNGCSLCNDTGYQGRVGVYELLQFSEGIRDLVGRRASHAEIRQLAIEEGLRTMAEQAFMLVTEEATSIDEVLRSVYSHGSDRPPEPKALGRVPAALTRRSGSDEGDAATSTEAQTEATSEFSEYSEATTVSPR